MWAKSENCSVNGSAGMTIATNGCSYEFKSAGGATGAAFNILCEVGKQIEVRIPNCTFTVGPQSLTGAKYHNVGEEGNSTTELTAETSNIKNVKATIAAGGTLSSCHVDPTEALTSEYVTGNVIATGETDPTEGFPVMGNTWWA